MDLRNNFSTDVAKKIFGNKDNAAQFLTVLSEIDNRINLTFKKNGDIDLKTEAIWTKIVEYWDFDNGQKIIRNMFENTPKYQSGEDSFNTMQILIEEWKKLSLDTIAWPFSQGDFDGFVQRLNSEKITGFEKDEKVKIAAVKYRRIKEINTVRNDFIETLIFKKNDNILPTLKHRRSVDFFINGVSFDQKVAKSPTDQFKKKYGDTNWRQAAIDNPAEVAEHLYTHQDEGRFGADSRLLVVYIDEDIAIDRIKEILDNTNFETPIEISFKYKHKNGGEKVYKVKCFIVLLYNK